MSVWKSDEKLLGFASLISPSKNFFFWRSNIEHLKKDETPRSPPEILPLRVVFYFCRSNSIDSRLEKSTSPKEPLTNIPYVTEGKITLK